MKRHIHTLFVLIALLTLTAFTATGCEIANFGDDDTGDASTSTDAAGLSDTDEAAQTARYFFVRLQSGSGTASSEERSEDPGADIDAVILNDSIEGQVMPTAVSLETDMAQFENYKPRDVTGAGLTINAFSETDPRRIGSGSTCDTSSSNFVSLGLAGDPGAIWTFPSSIDEGDSLSIVEVGGCSRESGGSSPGAEPYNIEVAVSNSIDSNWVPIGVRQNDAPVSVITVPSLPTVLLTD